MGHPAAPAFARRTVCLVVLLLAAFLPVSGVLQAQQFDPALRFRTLRTDHFAVHFHQGEDHLAARLASIAEETWRTYQRPGEQDPPGLTHVVLADQTELANGYATPLPRNAMVIFAAWPAGSDSLITDDWLRLVFTHEFVHVVHLDRARGWAAVARRVFGRTPVAFPNLFLPGWQIEGLATYEESVQTGRGRLHSGSFRAIVNEAARTSRLEPLDRVNGGLTDWPAGQADYAYGLEFHSWLSTRYGRDSLTRLAEATAGTLPFLGSRAFQSVYGKSLGTLWKEHQDDLAAAQSHAPAAPAARQLTRHGFVVVGPRFARTTCDTCPAEILYSTRNPHGFPGLHSLSLDEGRATAPVELTTRFFGSTTGPGDRFVYFDQIEFRRNAGVYSDLYTFDRANGQVRQLTREARLSDPDLSPDQQTIVAVKSHAGQRDLVLVHLGTGSQVARSGGAVTEVVTLSAGEDTQFNSPRWSPDGRSVAAARQRLGGLHEIVVIDIATREVRVAASTPGVRWVTPTWRRDGRAIVAAADPDEGPFNLYEIDLDSSVARPLTFSTGGASWPDVSPDGRTVVYAGYGPSGFDLFEIPYEVRSSPQPGFSVAPVAAPVVVPVVTQVTGPGLAAPGPVSRATTPGPPDSAGAHPYSPLKTILPTSWSPVIEGTQDHLRAGAVLASTDLLGYHAYAFGATWRVSTPERARPSGTAGPDWRAAYAYQRWRPALWASASSETRYLLAPAAGGGVAPLTTRREREFEAGVRVPIVHARMSQTIFASVLRAFDERTDDAGRFERTRAAARFAWGLRSARRYGYSISDEDGVALGVTTEFARTPWGGSAEAMTVTGDARVYAPGLAAHHVVALRVGGGMTRGDTGGRLFVMGGGDPDSSTVDFGSEAFALLRGFPSGSFAGTRVAVTNIDYRFPLFRPQRGAGTWPLFLHTIHGAVFGDAGTTWTGDSTGAINISLGAEMSANLVLGYYLPLTTTFGAAWGRDGRPGNPGRTTFYVRIGQAF